MRRPGPMRFSTEKPKDFKKTLKVLLTYFKAYRISIIIVILFAILSTVFSIIGPKILGKVTTEIFNGLISSLTGAMGINFEKIGNLLLILLGLYTFSLICSFIQNFIMSSVTQKISYQLRKNISQKINKLPLSYFEKQTHGEILSKITNDIDLLSNNLSQSITQIIVSITLVIGVLIMMLSISPLMTLAIIATLPISLGSINFIVKKSQKYFQMQQEYLGHINGHVEEMYSGHNVIKAFNGEEAVIKKFDKINDTLYTSAWKSQFLSGIMPPLMHFLSNISYVIISLLGGYLVIIKRLEIGAILSFSQYARNFTNPLTRIAQIVNLLQATTAAAERVFELLNEEEESKNVKDPVSIENIKGNITFKNVCFGYQLNKIIIDNFSAEIKKGQKIAIVGPTGAGKTTIVKLLMRFYDVNSGEILIDGHNIKDFNRHKLRKLFGMVLQDTWLFNGTIKENIRYGNLDATDDDVIKAAKATKIDHFIRTLPNGYDMVLNEETDNLSQGQKQLLTIARVILANPKILILDEATSNVDTRTEVLIQEAMDELMKGRTSFIIAHRLSTIRNADLILVMDNGKIVEQGKHEELLKKNGFYAELYYSQFENI
ncbi:MAG: ABC transporter ATP-binding protein [Mollicutes bacterium]|jgi:ATP-binding cassette subfamily B protein|nr:ABC transporter ATP-binding protein [Mollicutes bacterium]